MRVTQIKRNEAGLPNLIHAFRSHRGVIADKAAAGIIGKPNTGGFTKNFAKSPEARLKLIRRVHARMVAEGKIIPPLDEAML